MRALSQVPSMCYLAAQTSNAGMPSFHITRVFTLQSTTSSSENVYELSDEHKKMLQMPFCHKDSLEEEYNRLLDSVEQSDSEDDMDDIDRELLAAEREKKLYNDLNRMIKRSEAMELPRTHVETQAMYPPGKPNDDVVNRNTADITIADDTVDSINPTFINDRVTKGKNTTNVPTTDTVPEHKLPYDDYKPIKLPANANSTSELISGIIQMPNIKGIKALQESIRIKDYSVDDYPPVNEDDIWLDAINDERKSRGEPEIVIPDGQDHEDNPDFVREKRALRLRHIRERRKRSHEARAHREAMNQTYYRKLPRNEMGFATLAAPDVDKLHYVEVMEELRARGYRTSGGERAARVRLKCAIDDNETWRYHNIVRQPLEETNENLPEDARARIADIKEKIKFLEDTRNPEDVMTAINRLKVRQEVMEFKQDPVGYLMLDRLDPDLQVSPKEAEELRNAPIVHDVEFIKAMNDPINRLPDIIPRTFNLQPDVERPYPRYLPHHKEELEELKKEYLSFRGGTHDLTLPEISQRFEISLHFLGDACCRLGARAPIPLDVPIRAIVSYSAIWDLIEFMNIADNMELEAFYSIMNVHEMAEEYGTTVEGVKEACDKLGIKLPFGAESRLNLHCFTIVEKLLMNPDEDPEFLKIGDGRPEPFRDYSDTRPVFPNSMDTGDYKQQMKEAESLLEEKT
ncbi:hypothetical protein BBOV_III002790 [Babesia bovis T2Bo]|uniref:Uncharacterized protein n=1 Tax=Babesia bovis TaxID=5865 RepID=A7AMR0_BABBO|nr:hypothetical protein BBOV_III002790 [Babesia bovis T2Bo]EDO07844.1 hypothetical protein BBOV_III002790 [Babesia bovis T2Bo]|eukprot:XP_001611412.1 hypothetical protein [Babesia bovis T2Bo]